MTLDSTGTSLRAAMALHAGPHWWRVAGRGGAGPTSAIWEFFVPQNADAATVDTSFGSTLDVNADGIPDVLVGAPDGATNIDGVVSLYFGVSGGTLSASHDITTASCAACYGFGHSVSSAGDVNGDGFGDYVIGADQDNHAYVFLGNATGTVDPFARTAAWRQRDWRGGFWKQRGERRRRQWRRLRRHRGGRGEGHLRVSRECRWDRGGCWGRRPSWSCHCRTRLSPTAATSRELASGALSRATRRS